MQMQILNLVAALSRILFICFNISLVFDFIFNMYYLYVSIFIPQVSFFGTEVHNNAMIHICCWIPSTNNLILAASLQDTFSALSWHTLLAISPKLP